MRYSNEHKLNATIYKNSPKSELQIGDSLVSIKMQAIADNILSEAHSPRLEYDNDENNNNKNNEKKNQNNKYIEIPPHTKKMWQ